MDELNLDREFEIVELEPRQATSPDGTFISIGVSSGSGSSGSGSSGSGSSGSGSSGSGSSGSGSSGSGSSGSGGGSGT